MVHLKGILAPEWWAPLGDAIDRAVHEAPTEGIAAYDTTAQADAMRAAGMDVLTDARAEAIDRPGRFMTVIGAWTYEPVIRRLALESPLGAIAGRLFGARKVNLYDDQTLIKEPGTREYTAFHTDEPYYHLRGEQVCAIWVSPDVVTEDSGAMRYVRGSHRWPAFFKPNVFVGRQTLSELGAGVDVEEQVPLPDIEGHPEDYDIVTIPSQPGDVIVHHSRLVHGSGPNYTGDTQRRAVSLRYAGDDVRWWFHRSAPPQPHQRHTLMDGDVIDCDQFPVVWRA